MPDHPNTLLTNLLAAHDSAGVFGCGLTPRLLDRLLDRHATPAGAIRLDRPIRSDGPAQPVPAGWRQASPRPAPAQGVAHAWR